MNFISSIKPISSILSASSRTTNFTSSSWIEPCLTWSINLPGVATTIWIPLLNWLYWRTILCPPYIATVLIPVYFANLLNSFVTCNASSRVGTSISACIGPLRLILILVNIGSAKAAVLPVPVWAWPITSTPFKANGITASWIGKGASNPFSLSALSIRAPSPNSWNVLVVLAVIVISRFLI